MLFKERDTILVEEPTYAYALPIFSDHHLNVVSGPTRTSSSMNFSDLEAKFKHSKVRVAKIISQRVRDAEF
jgi:DNA-binding transcriptional MocR family regulator